MKLLIDVLSSPLIFKENKVKILIIENKLFFRNLIQDLHNSLYQLEDGIILSIDNKEISISKHVELVFDIFNLSLNNIKVMKKVYEELNTLALDQTNMQYTMEIKTLIEKYINDIIFESRFDVVINDSMSLIDLFKVSNISFEEGTYIVQRIIDYLIVCSISLSIKLFVFINLKQYLSSGELKEIYAVCSHHKIFILLIESFCYDYIEGEDRLILDNDLCEI